MAGSGTVIVTGGSKGIGVAVVQSFLDRGYAVVATARNASGSPFASSPNLALVDGDISKAAAAKAVAEVAISRFGSIDHLVANAGIFIGKPFLEYIEEDYRALTSTNLEGFFHIAKLAVKQMLTQGRGGSVISITAASVDSSNADSPNSVPMFTKGALNAATLALAAEFAKQDIRFNAVAPGIVDTPMHANNPKDFLKTLCRWAGSRHPRMLRMA
ncbi:3-oxoacyl-[acyl-carrier protein] reductase [Acidisarcina polymorpha]|uniref:3-oxoacyl-[acyl-carrier protein] reductase n=1 Tax=Acidisarcina polymorpha TaxID=2211140 RepID=A0A2Z5FTT8_9BACT|nr:SDR family oxidoreductase [Acidisarcina polymorpha]AXC10233.1 3-oxoacyl-[acyl-carrier protein] reductase [Acidisarcina polymorpha]